MITEPAIVKFSAEQLRVAADAMETAALTLETLVARYEDWGVEALMPANPTPEQLAEVIDDKAGEEGRPVYRVGYVMNYIANARALLSQFNTDLGGGNTMRKQLRYMATNPKNPLLG